MVAEHCPVITGSVGPHPNLVPEDISTDGERIFHLLLCRVGRWVMENSDQ